MSWLRIVAAGISSAVRGRARRRDERNARQAEFDSERQLANLDANQERESLLYRAMLEEEARQNRRRERMRGGANYAQFSSDLPGYVNLAPVNPAERPFTPAPRINL